MATTVTKDIFETSSAVADGTPLIGQSSPHALCQPVPLSPEPPGDFRALTCNPLPSAAALDSCVPCLFDVEIRKQISEVIVICIRHRGKHIEHKIELAALEGDGSSSFQRAGSTVKAPPYPQEADAGS